MDQPNSFHILTVGSIPELVRDLWNRIAARGGYKISHIAHPSYDYGTWQEETPARDVYFFRDDIRMPIPPADRGFLACLEGDGVPTIHNMIMSDRVVSKLPYDDAIAYAGLLSQRLVSLYEAVQPTVVISGFDGLHGSLAFAVARRMRIPWYAPLFSPLPRAEAAFCTDLTPASRVVFDVHREVQLRPKAEQLLAAFEGRKIEAAAYIPPPLFSALFIFWQIPTQILAFVRVLRRRRLKRFLKYTDYPKSYSVSGLVGEAFRLRKNLWLLHRRRLLERPIEGRFAFFGLHMQPESSIDVFAHFFSNQERVIELMARSLPPTHTLLIKLHKSDTPNYSTGSLARLSRFPGVELVSPYADTIEFIKRAELVFSIQGTIGLEGALLGKPVIMFGDSPFKVFPSVSAFGKTTDLPELVRQKLVETAPSRSDIVTAFAAYLTPLYPASSNDWSLKPTDAEIDAYVKLFELLKGYVAA
jgi:Capsule polysaccharide biosynthesis protein